MVCAIRVPGNCFMLFGFSCNICCFGSCSTNANSTNFLKTEPMRLPHFVCMAVYLGESKREIERESAVQSRSAPYFAAMEVIFKMHYRFISCCYLHCNLKCIQALAYTLIPSRLCLSFSDIMMYVGLVTFNVLACFSRCRALHNIQYPCVIETCIFPGPSPGIYAIQASFCNVMHSYLFKV